MSASEAFVREKLLMGLSPREYLRSLATPFNFVAAAILAVGLPTVVWRYVHGLAAVSHLSQTWPWGLWVAFDVVSGVALAAGGYTVACIVWVFGQCDYRPVLRPAILTGFLGYVFVLIGLLVDLGQPWRLPYQFFLTPGTTAVMYEVGWCVFLYLLVLAVEFLPAPLDWLGLKRLKSLVLKLTMGIIVLGVTLSTLHQSSLGAFFVMTPGKLHPLWFSPFLPLFFFVSSIAGGIGMVIVESTLSHRAFHDRLDPARAPDVDRITLGLSRGGAVVLFSYFFLKLQGFIDTWRWDLLPTRWGAWYGVEMLGFILLPSFLFAYGARHGSLRLVRWTAAWTVLGIVVNRMNIAFIAINWSRPTVYYPSWMEIVISVTIITIGVLTFRWIVNRMPVLRKHPAYGDAH